MVEKGKFLGRIRNLTAAAVLIPLSVSSDSVSHDQFNNDRVSQPVVEQRVSENDSFLKQFDDYLETDYGKILAGSIFVFSLASSAYRLQKSWEQDSKRKIAESLGSSVFLIALSLNLLSQTETDVDPRITCALLNSFTGFNSIYMIESTMEADRKLSKRLPSFVTAASLLALSSIITLETIDKS